ncbi:glucoamylase [Mycena galericulata]|nr:glucoamylase [Mycena galericulata]
MLIYSILSACTVVSAVLVQSTRFSIDSYMGGMLANIGPMGSKAPDVPAGIVIASPSKTNPPYFYTWTRDSSLVFKCIIDKYSSGQYPELQGLITQFVQAEAKIQSVSNPSGNISSGGLGEPKFNVDETAFTGAWGRPQRDGPALRGISVMTYAALIKNDTGTILNTLWPMIKFDLDYVQNDWSQTSFDLWEELNGHSFFTTAVQHRALRQGASLAKSLGLDSIAAGYSTTADNVLCFLQSYWNSGQGFIIANTGGGRSGKDANTVLASIHTFDANSGCDSTTFQPCSDKALANLKVYVDSFRSAYGINSGIASNAAVATGRYPEDSYMGGNPWYLTTFAVAEHLYRAVTVWKVQGFVVVTNISLAFFQQFDSTITPATYPASSSVFSAVIEAITTHADGYVAINNKYTPSNGGLSEQFSRSNGAPLSAMDLTWSYASAVTALDAQAGTTLASSTWGASGLSLRSGCSTGGGAAKVSVTFRETVSALPGGNVYLVGSIPELMNWNPNQAIPMTETTPNTWTVTVELPSNVNLQYKYIRKSSIIEWESDPNREFSTPSGGTIIENDTWR